MKCGHILLLLMFITGLASCDQVIDTPPYLVGTFTGTYQPGSPDENYFNNFYPPRKPVTIESRLVSVISSRYEFEGTVSLDGEIYDMTGYEESKYSDLAYLKPQVRAVDGNFLMSLGNEAGVTYSICGATHYGSAGLYVIPEEPYASGSSILTGTLTSWEDCFYPEGDTIVGTIDELEK